ncbi:hypothetical protein [Woodsholea maritima]|uniref:hypothetical protein n=1 Tax=Woodsholea maritima TaxID=240237 RepID=UPI0012EAC407|nr:hypothetical protein [Woodsholea maritima]
MKAKLTLSLCALLLSACATSTHIQPSADLEQRVNECFRDCTERTAECSEEYIDILNDIRKSFRNISDRYDGFKYIDFMWILAPGSITEYSSGIYYVHLEEMASIHCHLLDPIGDLYFGSYIRSNSDDFKIIYIYNNEERDVSEQFLACLNSQTGYY